MKWPRLKKKNLVAGVLFLVVTFTTIILPINYASPLNSAGEPRIKNLVLADFGNDPFKEQPPSNFIEQSTADKPCTWKVLGEDIGCFFLRTIPAFIATMSLAITSWFLMTGGLILNLVFKFTVVEMSENIGKADAINVAWKTMRDLANLVFIFIFLYITIGIIIGTTSSRAQKLLVNLILVALLLNFSLFFTKIIIDASNIVTVGFYNKIIEVPAGGSGITGLSQAFMDRLGLTSLYSSDVASALGGLEQHSTWTILIIGLFGSILFVVTGFVFFAAAFLFIMRYVILVFLMIFSPLAFAAAALPNDKYSSKWWEKLWDNAIFAPAFIIMTWIVLQILNVVIKPGGANITELVTGTASSVGLPNVPGELGGLAGQAPGTPPLAMLMNFIIIITMMVATLVVAKQLGAAGASGATRTGNRLRGWTQSLIGRNTIGRAARWADEKLGERRFFNLTPIQDLREKTVGALATTKWGGGYSGTDIYREELQRKERRLDISKEVDALKHAEIAGKAHRESKNKIEEAEKITDKKEREAKIEAINRKLELFDDNAQRAMSRLSPKAFGKLAEKRYYDKDFMRYATAAQYLEVQKGDRLNENKKEQVTEARFAYIKEAITNREERRGRYWEKNRARYEELEDKLLATADKKKKRELEKELHEIEKDEPGLGEVYEDIRRKGVKEHEVAIQHDPELYKNATFVSSIGSQTIKDIRNSDAVGRIQKDDIRTLKYDAILQNAIELDKLEAELDEELKKDLPKQDAQKKVALKKAIARFNRRMDKAWGGKNAQEIKDMRGRIWKKKASMRRLDRGTLPGFVEKDNVEKEFLMGHFISELELENKTKGKREVTGENVKAIEWLLNVNAGRNFYPPLADKIRTLAKQTGRIKVIDDKEVKDE